MLPFALALAALLLARGKRGEAGSRAERWTLAAVLAVAVLLAPGEHSPVHALAYRVLPLYASMRCPARALYVYTLAVPMLAADGLDLCASYLRQRVGARAATLAAVVAVLITAGDLLHTHRAENPTTTLAASQQVAFPDVARVLQQGRGSRYINDVHLDHALHNSGMLWNVENASGYSSTPIWRYLHLLWIANHGRPYPHARLHDDLSAQGIWRFASPIVDALNIRYVLAPAGHPPDGSGYTKRSTGERGIDVYENTEALDRAWVVHRAEVVGSEAEAAREVARADFDPAHVALLEEAPSPAPAMPPSGDGFRRLSAFTSTDPGEMVFGVDLDAPGLLVISEPAHPGWRATLDGKEARLLTADYALLAVAVPAGEHTIFLRMTSRPLDAGLLLAGAAVVALLALLLRSKRPTPAG
jgi:hypothetical protein